MADGKMTVMLEIKDKEIKDEIEAILSSMVGFQICHGGFNSKSADFYDLLVLEVGSDFNTELQFANTLRSNGIIKDIVLISALTDPDVLMDALRMEVKGFISVPVKKEEVITAFLKIKKQRGEEGEKSLQAKKGRIINVLGCKGGVGVTTIAVNLAVSFAELEGTPSVVLIDLNRSYGEIAHILNIKPVSDWIRVVKNIFRVDKMYLMSILTKHPSGFYVLPSPDIGKTDEPIDIQSLILLLKFMQTVFDFIVIDSGNSVDECSYATLRISDKVLLVCYASVPCIINLKKYLEVFWERGYPNVKNVEIIMNRYIKDSDISIKEIEAALHGKKILSCIPNSYKITMNAINSGKPLCTIAHGTDICKKFRELVLNFSEAKDKEKKKEKTFP